MDRLEYKRVHITKLKCGKTDEGKLYLNLELEELDSNQKVIGRMVIPKMIIPISEFMETVKTGFIDDVPAVFLDECGFKLEEGNIKIQAFNGEFSRGKGYYGIAKRTTAELEGKIYP